MAHEISLIIVEDEDRIRALIKSLINWDELKLRLTGEFSNGADALEALQGQYVDVMITDIRMPGINGLELAQWVNDNKPDTSVIIISGYRQFDYAHNALRLSVVDFLLKPIKRAELNNALMRIIQSRALGDVESKNMQVELEQFRMSLRKQCIQRFLYNTLPAGMSLDEFNRLHAMHFAPGAFVALSVWLYSEHLNLEESLLAQKNGKHPNLFPDGFGRKLQEMLLACLLPKVIDIEADFIGDTIYCVANLPFDAKGAFERALKRYIDMLKEHLAPLELKALVCVSAPYPDFGSLPGAIDEVQMLLPCRCTGGDISLVFAKDQPPSITSLNSLGMERAFKKAVETWENEDLLKHIHQCFAEQRLQLLRDPRLITDFLYQVLGALWLVYPNRSDYSQDGQRIILKYFLARSPSLDRLEENCCDFVATQLAQLSEEASAALSMPIRAVKGYVQTHYMEQVSLEQLSAAANLSPTYLCNVFKAETGETINHYLQQVRIEKAQQLLASSMMNVSEIADAVGYGDAKYFSRIFRKHLGIRPSEFRRLNKWD